MKQRLNWMIAGIGAGLLVAAVFLFVGGTFTVGAQAKPTVVVTIAPQAAFVREIAADRVAVVTVLPPGANHETYSMPPQDMVRLSSATLYLTLGLAPERAHVLPRVTELNRDLRIVDVQAEVARDYAPRYFAPGDPDPHIWLSPKRAVVMVQLTARELGAIDPDNRAIYDSNALRLVRRIQEVDRELKAAFNSLPNRTFIVYHPAFGYFADDYRLNMVALEEEGKEADPGRMREIIDLARDKGIKIIFYQDDIDGRQSRTFAEELSGRALKVSPMAVDYVENLQRMARAFAEGLK